MDKAAATAVETEKNSGHLPVHTDTSGRGTDRHFAGRADSCTDSRLEKGGGAPSGCSGGSGCRHHCAACRGRISQRAASLCRGAQAGTAFCLRGCGRGIAPAGQKSGGIGISSGRGRAAYLGEGAFLSGK